MATLKRRHTIPLHEIPAHERQFMSGAKKSQKPTLYDKNGYPLMVGDLVKIYHFTAARYRKKFYMYKIIRKLVHEKHGHWLFFMDHVPGPGSFFMLVDNRVLPEWEILCGHKELEERSRRNTKESVPVHHATAKGMQAQTDAPATV